MCSSFLRETKKCSQPAEGQWSYTHGLWVSCTQNLVEMGPRETRDLVDLGPPGRLPMFRTADWCQASQFSSVQFKAVVMIQMGTC